MEFKTNRVDEANVEISATLLKETIETNLNKIAKEASKTMNVEGFRKGKVPISIVKQRYGSKLQEDAEGEVLRSLLNKALEELDIPNENLVGEPSISKFDKKDDGNIEVEIKVACKPNVELGDYKALLPQVEDKEIEDSTVEEKLEEMAKSSAPLTKIAEKRMIKEGDFAVIDFEGFVDEVAFDGGKAEKFSLEIGSKSFIPGFEEQIIGMNYEEEKDITVTFPEEYQSKDLAGKEAVFKVKLHEIQEKSTAELDDEFAKKMLNEDDATLDLLKARTKEKIKMEEKSKYFREELKPVYLQSLVDTLKFALPNTVVEEEINHVLNNKVKTMSEDEIKELQENASKVTEMREELKGDAEDSVKATFIIDALAKAEGVDISDQEVTQVLYLEAMQTGQNPQETLKQYKEAGYLPVIKMQMIEEKVITKLLNEKLGN